jgi:hypothetical protein
MRFKMWLSLVSLGEGHMGVCESEWCVLIGLFCQSVSGLSCPPKSKLLHFVPGLSYFINMCAFLF